MLFLRLPSVLVRVALPVTAIDELTSDDLTMALQEETFPVQPIVKAHFIINCVIVAITLAVVVLRMTSRFITSASLWWDDFLILLSMPQGIGMLVIQGLCK